MAEVGAFEAKTHLPKLLERVQNGERFVITKHGHPIAELVPYRQREPEKIRAAQKTPFMNRFINVTFKHIVNVESDPCHTTDSFKY